MTSHTTPEIARRSKTLLDRLSKDEMGQPATAGSHIVGRLVTVCSALENLLREVIIELANQERCPPGNFLSLVGGRKPDIRRSMAGPLAHGLREAFSARGLNSLPAGTRVLIEDLLRRDSSILRFISVRNDIAKADGDPAGARAASQALKRVVVDFRSKSGL